MNNSQTDSLRLLRWPTAILHMTMWQGCTSCSLKLPGSHSPLSSLILRSALGTQGPCVVTVTERHTLVKNFEDCFFPLLWIDTGTLKNGFVLKYCNKCGLSNQHFAADLRAENPPPKNTFILSLCCVFFLPTKLCCLLLFQWFPTFPTISFNTSRKQNWICKIKLWAICIDGERNCNYNNEKVIRVRGAKDFFSAWENMRVPPLTWNTKYHDIMCLHCIPGLIVATVSAETCISASFTKNFTLLWLSNFWCKVADVERSPCSLMLTDTKMWCVPLLV